MTTILRLDERELIQLGFSRTMIATLRDMQRVTGNTSDVMSIEDTQALFMSLISEFRATNGRLTQRIEELEQQLAMIKTPRVAPQKDEMPAQMPNLSPILRRLDDLEALVLPGA